MSIILDFSNLRIIGYSNRLTEAFTPTVVVPIFQVKSSGEYVNDFSYTNGFVTAKNFLSEHAFEDLLDQEMVTKFHAHQVIETAKAGYELWLDDGMNVHYEPTVIIKDRFQVIAHDRRFLAERALERQEFKTALKHASNAHLVQDETINTAMVAVASCLAGNDARKRRMEEIAKQRGETNEFEILYDYYMGLAPCTATTSK